MIRFVAVLFLFVTVSSSAAEKPEKPTPIVDTGCYLKCTLSNIKKGTCEYICAL